MNIFTAYSGGRAVSMEANSVHDALVQWERRPEAAAWESTTLWLGERLVAVLINGRLTNKPGTVNVLSQGHRTSCIIDPDGKKRFLIELFYYDKEEKR